MKSSFMKLLTVGLPIVENERKNIVYIALGSNLGNRFLNIKEAIFSLAEKMGILEISSIEETEPVGFLNQPKFLNSVLKAQTELTLREVFSLAKDIEKSMGRISNFKDGPRIIDIDILFYNDEVIDEPDLKIPHPRLQERGFVLKPLAEISPEFKHPVLNKTIRELLIEAVV